MEERLYRPGESYDYQLTLKKLLNTPLIYSPDREIVFRDRFRGTYRLFNERIHRLAGALAAVGTGPGDIVAVLDYDSHRYLECFFAIPMMGAVLQTVNWRLSADQILYTLNHAKAKRMIVHSDFLPVITSLWDKLEAVQTVVAIVEDGQVGDDGPETAGEYEKLLASAEALYPFPELGENTKATTFYTTGTTGSPKGVYFSHRQLMLHTFSVAMASASYHTIGRFRSDDVYMPLTPMFHVHAWGYPYVATLLGAKQVYPGRYEPEKLLALIEKENVTVSHCVPTILQMLLNCPAAKKTDLSRWKVIIGGARLPRGLARAAQDAGIEIHAGYGMSETCPVMSAATPKEHMLNWGKDKLKEAFPGGLPNMEVRYEYPFLLSPGLKLVC